MIPKHTITELVRTNNPNRLAAAINRNLKITESEKYELQDIKIINECSALLIFHKTHKHIIEEITKERLSQ